MFLVLSFILISLQNSLLIRFALGIYIVMLFSDSDLSDAKSSIVEMVRSL